MIVKNKKAKTKNKKATAKYKSHGKIKKLWQN